MTERTMLAEEWDGYVRGIMDAMIAVAKITGEMKIEDFNEQTWKMTCQIHATLAGMAAHLSQERSDVAK